eukprot:TRINITY_DN1279_c0_g2_i1.p1 TRINITY_DN1279_c0_g2~~TRINITY_DN1279_c0_g2_i1.p1  ORF type:complete len:303 (+),score=87.70 TRINITY_DN1279_c0_g2_i1:52-909(+)
MFQPAAPRIQGHVHAEFKAGRMDWDGRMVTADKRKGKIVLFTSEEDQLTHLTWWDRDKNEQVTDLIVINDAYFERVEKCTTGRVYILRFTSSDKKMFFWMQEPKDEKDAGNIKKFNDAIGATIPEKQTGATGAPATSATPATGATPAIDPALRAMLSQLLQQQSGQGAARPTPIPLTAVLTTEVLASLHSDEAAATEMMDLLPDSHKSPEGLREVLASPQLQQSLVALTQAVHSDQLPVLLASMGLSADLITSIPPGTDALEMLCKAMESHFKEGGSDSGGAGSS